jgi:hypothetical protein
MADEGGKNSLLKKLSENTALGFIAALAAYLLIGLLIGAALYWVIDPNAIKDSSKAAQAKKDLAQALAFIMAGLAGAIGIYFTWRSLNQTWESTQETLKLTARGQITERFTAAIDQLGSTDDKGNPRLEIRIGGIYSLEQIAREDSSGSYYRAVMEVLTAYVRKNAPWYPHKAKRVAILSADILAIVDVLRLRKKDPALEEVPVHIELYRVQLNLQRTDLYGASLWRADLSGANLQSTNLQEANLFDADLGSANLQGANLQKATIHQAELQQANLRGANLREADLLWANIPLAHLEGTDLRGANLKGVRQELTVPFPTPHPRTSPVGPILQGADLRGADLRGADLRDTVGIAQEQLETVFGDAATKLPEGLEMPKSWTPSKDEETDKNKEL